MRGDDELQQRQQRDGDDEEVRQEGQVAGRQQVLERQHAREEARQRQVLATRLDDNVRRRSDGQDAEHEGHEQLDGALAHDVHARRPRAQRQEGAGAGEGAEEVEAGLQHQALQGADEVVRVLDGELLLREGVNLHVVAVVVEQAMVVVVDQAERQHQASRVNPRDASSRAATTRRALHGERGSRQQAAGSRQQAAIDLIEESEERNYRCIALRARIHS